MRRHIAARKIHKWLGLILGLQVVIWSLSGIYMTVVHIDTIHGDHLIRSLPQQSAPAAELADPLAINAAHDGQGVRLAWVRNLPAYLAGDGRADHPSPRAVAHLRLRLDASHHGL